jgi:protein SCO1/2
MSRQRYWIAAGICLSVLLVWLAFFWEPDIGAPAGHPGPGTLRAAGQPLGGDFTLDSPGGKLALQDYRGKVVLVYFGYTFCPDVCPTSLSALGQAFTALTPEELAQVQGVFVSVDPERDTQEVLSVYAPFFHPRIVGATGTPARVAEVARRYGVSYMKQKPVDDRPYTVDHSSFTYLIDREGRLAALLPHGAPVADIVLQIRRLLGDKGKPS